MAQAAHETAGFYHLLALKNNNYAGIKYTKNLSAVAIPSEDYFAPRKEGRVPYARFKDIYDFIKRWIPYANLNHLKFENNIGTPIDATNLTDYAHRLKLNHYYGDTEANYLNGLISWNSIIQDELQPGTISLKIAKNSSLSNKIMLKSFDFSGSISENALSNIPPIIAIDKTRIAIPLINDRKTGTISGSAITTAETGLQPYFLKLTINEANENRGSGIPLTRPIKLSNNTSAINVSKDLINLQRVIPPEQKNTVNPTEIIKNIFLNYPGIKNKWSIPELYNQRQSIDVAYLSPFATSPILGLDEIVTKPDQEPNFGLMNIIDTANNNRKDSLPFTPWERSFLLTANEEFEKGDLNTDVLHLATDTNKNVEGVNNPLDNINSTGNNFGRTVHINLNTPVIGNFTINTKDTNAGLADLKHEVEEVLLEVLNSANTIQ